MTSYFTATVFHRHNRQLRTLMLESQAWISLRDLGRLMGVSFNERTALKLDPDQRRTVWLESAGQYEKGLIVSESGAYALLVHHHVPENRALRRWFTYAVLPVLRATEQNQPAHLPEPSQLAWKGAQLALLQWQDEAWIKLRDVPAVLEAPQVKRVGRGWYGALGLWLARIKGRT